MVCLCALSGTKMKKTYFKWTFFSTSYNFFCVLCEFHVFIYFLRYVEEIILSNWCIKLSGAKLSYHPSSHLHQIFQWHYYITKRIILVVSYWDLVWSNAARWCSWLNLALQRPILVMINWPTILFSNFLRHTAYMVYSSHTNNSRITFVSALFLVNFPAKSSWRCHLFPNRLDFSRNWIFQINWKRVGTYPYI